MPEISRFLGIVIAMHYNDHVPPHFHAKYGDRIGVFSINDLRLLEGDLPTRIVSYVLEWATDHRDELLADWQLCQDRKPLKRIEPLV